MRSQTIFECSKCGGQSPKWQGRCLECGSWGTMVEGTIDKRQETRALGVQPAEVIDFFNIQGLDVARISAGIGEFDRVLGGGIVPGSLILLGGEPGIGKSTLLLQLAAALSRPSVIASEAKQSHETQDYHGLRTRDDTNVVLYSSGEESAEQIKMRFDRLGLNAQNIKYLGETDIDIICATIAAKKPALAIIDSIQTATTQDVESPFGSVSQIKAAAAKLMEAAKTSRVPIIIIGHITKDGDIAGPKTLEHMVDAVLYFEGESLSHYRILRAIKNRFGNTNEIGIFEMTQQGLKEIANPSLMFLEQKSDVSGSVLTCALGGNRPILVEIQALTSPTTFGYPMRKASGFDLNRLNIIAAIINQRTGVRCSNQDIVLNVAGGIKLQDPAADLAVALAIISSVKNKILPRNFAAISELGLGGELRQVPQLEKRVEEAKRIGISKIITSQSHKTLQGVIDNVLNH